THAAQFRGDGGAGARDQDPAGGELGGDGPAGEPNRVAAQQVFDRHVADFGEADPPLHHVPNPRDDLGREAAAGTQILKPAGAGPGEVLDRDQRLPGPEGLPHPLDVGGGPQDAQAEDDHAPFARVIVEEPQRFDPDFRVGRYLLRHQGPRPVRPDEEGWDLLPVGAPGGRAALAPFDPQPGGGPQPGYAEETQDQVNHEHAEGDSAEAAGAEDRAE